MRARNLVTLALIMLLLLIFSVLLSGVAFMQEAPGLARPTATPEALPANYQPSVPAAPEALPDLIVQGIQVSPASPYVNQGATIYVTIKNVGTADVAPGNNFFLDFYINPPTDNLSGLRGDVYWPVQGYTMRVGQSAVFTTTKIFTDTVSYNLWAQVDTPTPPLFPLGDVLESNEDNNILGPQYVTVRTRNAWVQKDHVDFYENMASTLDTVPVAGTVGIITNTPGLVIQGDSALVLGVFEEPPRSTWGLSPTIPPADMPDYNMIDPDRRLNEVTTNDQRFPFIHAEGDLVVAVWEDGRNGPIYGKDIYLRWSNDAGETWQPPGDMKVNESYQNHDRNEQKHPAVAVASNGRIVVAWQDHRDPSFDIYVQVFDYVGGTLRPCHANGDCSTACSLAAEACNFRVDTDANDKDQILPDIAVDELGHFFVAWQDQRNGNDDIFAARSYTTTAACPMSKAERALLSDSRVKEVASPDQVHLCWGDDTRIHDDPSATKQAEPSINAMHGYYVADLIPHVDPGPPPQVISVTVVLSETTFVVASWQDWREGDPDIYLTYSLDGGETFGIDERVNDDKPANSTNNVVQAQTAVDVAQWQKTISVVVDTPYGPAEALIEVPVSTMHIVWQDYRNSTDVAKSNNPDVYYNRRTIEPSTVAPYGLTITDEGQEKVNSNDLRAWQTEPVWQGDPDVVAQTTQSGENYNSFVVWSDGRNWGGELGNLDIYGALYGSTECIQQLFIGGNNLPVNDGAALHNFTLASYPDYGVSYPPAAHQRNPSIAATIVIDCPLIKGGYVYTAWDDDRIANPFEDRNIYFARSNLTFGGHYNEFHVANPDVPGQGVCYGSGAFVSKIFDSMSIDTTWYIVDWHAVTDNGTYITLQTRLGDTIAEVLGSDWYPKRFPYPDDTGTHTIGSPLQGYDAPGQHIVAGAGGGFWPQARYIQYRVNFWARDMNPDVQICEKRTPFLYDVILHYERPPVVYLPVVYKNY
jgi:hypothetical protein